MNERVKVVMNWSSGKDAALAYHLLSQNDNYAVHSLLTTISQEHDRIFMHGVREQLLDMQAQRMNLPLLKIKLPASPDDSIYKTAMHDALLNLKQEGVTTAAYGDIFLDDLKNYRESQLAQLSFTGLFPLWKRDTRELVQLLEQTGIEAITVCVSEKHLGKEFLGQKINADFINSLPPGVDPCGENGEFHTFVCNAPFFSSPIPIHRGETVFRSYKSDTANYAWDTGFYFLDLTAQA